MNVAIYKPDGEVIINTFQYERCLECIRKSNKSSTYLLLCPNDCLKKRVTYRTGETYELFICSTKAKTTKNFNILVENIVYSIPTLLNLYCSIKKETLSETTQRVDRVVHNLKTLNAHSIQELYTLIPQEDLMRNLKRSSSVVSSIIEKNTNKAAKVFLHVAKLNLGIKAEFSIYEKLLRGNYNLLKSRYNIRDVVMIVLYPFFTDFSEKGVIVNVQDSYEKACFDFESFQVAMYHIIENAAKYVLRNSVIDISFAIHNSMHIVTFSMKSLFLNPSEEQDIFKEGFSGELAKRIGQNGKGIGMYRARKLLELNGGTIEFIAGDNMYTVNNVEYADNKIVVCVPDAKG